MVTVLNSATNYSWDFQECTVICLAWIPALHCTTLHWMGIAHHSEGTRSVLLFQPSTPTLFLWKQNPAHTNHAHPTQVLKLSTCWSLHSTLKKKKVFFWVYYRVWQTLCQLAAVAVDVVGDVVSCAHLSDSAVRCIRPAGLENARDGDLQCNGIPF